MESWLLTVAVTVLLHLFRLLHPHTLCSLYTHCVASRELQMAWTWLEAAAPGEKRNGSSSLRLHSLSSPLKSCEHNKIKDREWLVDGWAWRT